MILSNILTLLRINLSHFELFLLNNLSRLFNPKLFRRGNFITIRRIKSLFKTNEKYRYGLRKTQSKHFKMLLIGPAKLKEFSWAKVLLIVLSRTFFVFPSSHRHLYFVV